MKIVEKKNRVRVYKYQGELLEKGSFWNTIRKMNRELGPILLFLAVVGFLFSLL